MTQCNPRGFYTVGKGSERVVHPVCGRGGSAAHYAERMARASRFAKKHGLKTGHVIEIPKLETFKPPQVRASRVGVQAGKIPSRIKASIRRREVRESKKLKGEAGLNMRVTGALARRFPNRVTLILEQASAAYHYRNPGVEVSPEPYELSEGGFIDEALESLGLPHVATLGS